MTNDEAFGSVEKSEKTGWWVAQMWVDDIDQAVLNSSGSEQSLFMWDGVVGRYKTKAEANQALTRSINNT